MAVLQQSRLDAARAQTLALVDGIADTELERVHSPLLSPLVWDLGHIATFEDLWLAHNHAGLPLLRPDLLDVYDAFETPRARRGDLAYLRRGEAERYMLAVRERVSDLGLGDDQPTCELVARHERQHAETMLQTIALGRIEEWRGGGGGAVSRDDDRSTVAGASGLELLEVPAASFALGAPADGFAYDNERPQHQVEVEAFAIGRVPVTNRDWAAFIEAGGYQRAQWWSPQGWAWRLSEDAAAPLHWLADGFQWQPGGARRRDPDAPVVHVSFHEAEAFARSHGLRLPTEIEWELAATFDHARGRKQSWPWGESPPTPAEANLIESAGFATIPPLAAGASPCGALGMIGDVWEWTASEFRGYPGFRPHPYREYSEVFFGPDHRVLRGGCFATSADVITPSFRNWDFPGRRQIFAGLRVAANR